MGKIELSAIVTVFSETFSVIETIDRLWRQDRGYIKEIVLVVSPGSSPESIAICESIAAGQPLVRVHIQQTNPGVGWALREGMELARGTHCVLMSADLETEPEAVDRMVRKIEATGCDCVIGNRWLKGGGFENYNPVKLVLNWMFQKVFRVLFRTRLGDLTYGFKILSKEVAACTEWSGTLHEIFIETTVRPLKAGFRIEEVPTVWVGRREGRSQNTFARNFRYVRLALEVLRMPGLRPKC